MPETADLTGEQRLMAYHVIDNIDAFLSKDRWLKGGWFSTHTDGPQRGYHTECLANFIRRVELGGTRINGTIEELPEDQQEQNYASMVSVTEGVVMEAIQELYPGEIRHMHFERSRLRDMGMDPDYETSLDYVEPVDCTLDHGRPCATCRAQRYHDEITVALNYGPFMGGSGDEVIPGFNDAMGTRFADVQRVIDRARTLITGVNVTNATDVLNEQERMEVELASIDAQADIDTERVETWFTSMEKRGWVKKKLTAREADKRVRRIRKWAEKEKEAVREDCINCT